MLVPTSVQMLSDVTNGDSLVDDSLLDRTLDGDSLTTNSLAASTVVETKPSGRWLVAAAVSGLFLALAWSVLSSVAADQDASDAAVTDDRSSDQAVDDDPNGDPGSDQIDDGQTENAQTDSDEAVNSDEAGSTATGVDGATEDEGTDSEQSPSNDDGAALDGEVGPPYVIVDEAGDPAEAGIVADMDFALVVSTRTGRFLLDPVTGGAEELLAEMAVLHLVTDTHIVARQGGQTISIKIADPEAAPVVLDFHFDESDVWATERPDQLRVNTWKSEQPIEFLHDLNTGVATEVEGARPQLWTQRVGRSDLISTIGAGVYRETADGYAKFSDGFGLTANSNEVLVNRCDERLRCVNEWLDRETGGALNYPVPAVATTNPWGFEASADGRWLLAFADGPLAISEIKTGRLLDLDRFAIPWGGPDIYRGFDLSADGSWLAYAAGASDVVLINLDTETEYRLSLDGSVQDVNLIPRSSLGN